jgi:DNA-binding LacI/PurR family transcriptional regulator
MRIALDHLAARGARRIAPLAPDAQWSWTDEMITAYPIWRRRRHKPQMVVPVPVRHLEGSAHDASLDLLHRPNPPDAILAGSERRALGVLRAANELSIRVPDEI